MTPARLSAAEAAARGTELLRAYRWAEALDAFEDAGKDTIPDQSHSDRRLWRNASWQALETAWRGLLAEAEKAADLRGQIEFLDFWVRECPFYEQEDESWARDLSRMEWQLAARRLQLVDPGGSLPKFAFCRELRARLEASDAADVLTRIEREMPAGHGKGDEGTCRAICTLALERMREPRSDCATGVEERNETRLQCIADCHERLGHWQTALALWRQYAVEHSSLDPIRRYAELCFRQNRPDLVEELRRELRVRANARISVAGWHERDRRGAVLEAVLARGRAHEKGNVSSLFDEFDRGAAALIARGAWDTSNCFLPDAFQSQPDSFAIFHCATLIAASPEGRAILLGRLRTAPTIPDIALAGLCLGPEFPRALASVLLDVERTDGELQKTALASLSRLDTPGLAALLERLRSGGPDLWPEIALFEDRFSPEERREAWSALLQDEDETIRNLARLRHERAKRGPR
ncbi:MAG: hypothetical protein HYZ53_19000 [Planctomycetes bacterium]|nr:hypothetical protein [Planctomycetota bacterium]